jgi:hypothetical protein
MLRARAGVGTEAVKLDGALALTVTVAGTEQVAPAGAPAGNFDHDEQLERRGHLQRAGRNSAEKSLHANRMGGLYSYDQLPPRPPVKQHKVIVVDPKVLEGYVGSYGLPPHVVLRSTRSGDHLAVQENDEPMQQLLAEGPSAFFSETADDMDTFEVDAQGHATVMTLHIDGRDIPIKRLP